MHYMEIYPQREKIYNKHYIEIVKKQNGFWKSAS